MSLTVELAVEGRHAVESHSRELVLLQLEGVEVVSRHSGGIGGRDSPTVVPKAIASPLKSVEFIVLFFISRDLK